MSKVEASQLVSYLRNLRCNKNLSAQQFENIDPSVHDQFVRCLKTEKLDETPIRYVSLYDSSQAYKYLFILTKVKYIVQFSLEDPQIPNARAVA